MFNTHGYAVLPALIVLALEGLVLAVYLTIGLFHSRSLVRREFSAYFLSPIAYVVLVVFLFVTGILFVYTLSLLTQDGPEGAEFPMQVMLGGGSFGQAMLDNDRLVLVFWLTFLFIPPALTMRLFAEERSTGTLEVLLTSPLREWQVVLSKYVACLAFYVVLWLPTLIYLPILLNLRPPVWNFEAWSLWSTVLSAGLVLLLVGGVLLLPALGTTARLVSLGLLAGGAALTGLGIWGHYWLDSQQVLRITAGPNFDPMPVLSSYLGVFLAGAMLLALGLFVSSLVRSQMIAALVSLVLSLVVFVAPALLAVLFDSAGPVARTLDFFSLPVHLSRDFSRGLVDTRHLVLYGSVTLFCLFLTVRSLESRRWS